MAELSERIAALSLEKRALLEQKLSEARKAGRDQLAEPARTLSPQERPARPPLSYGQQRIWFLDQLEGSTAQYILSQALRLEGELSSWRSKAIQALVDRHEILRTRFDELEGEPFQIIESTLRLAQPLIDLSNLEERRRDLAINQELSQACEEPFNLRTGPLIRTKLLKIGTHTHILSVAFHHIVSDGWSITGLLRRIRKILRGFPQRSSKSSRGIAAAICRLCYLAEKSFSGDGAREAALLLANPISRSCGA